MLFGHHVLRREQRLPGPPEAVFPFFADAGNLEAITPGWLGVPDRHPAPDRHARRRADRVPAAPARRAGLLADADRGVGARPRPRFVDAQLKRPVRALAPHARVRARRRRRHAHARHGPLRAAPTGRSARSRAGCSWRATSRRSSTSAPSAWRARSLDRERALHALRRGGCRPGSRTCRSRASGRRSPTSWRSVTVSEVSSTPLPSISTACGVRRRVVEVDRDRAGLGLQLGLVELQRAVRGRRERELLAAAAAGSPSLPPLLARAGVGLDSFAAAAGEREQRARRRGSRGCGSWDSSQSWACRTSVSARAGAAHDADRVVLAAAGGGVEDDISAAV